MICPRCGHDGSRVLESREADGGGAIRRRRTCATCDARYTTFERHEEAPLWVVKRDGRRQPFDRGKLLRGLERACAKRPVPVELIERTSHAVEAELRADAQREIETERIGDTALAHLRLIDGVAYVRFASVYRQFEDVDEFQRELELLDHSQTYVR